MLCNLSNGSSSLYVYSDHQFQHGAQTPTRALLLSSLVLFCARLIPDGHLPGLELLRNIGPFAEAGGLIVGSLANGYPSHSPLLATRGSCG